MELIDSSVSARNLVIGSYSSDVTAGKSLKIETSPRGEDILDIEVPVGESWHVVINIQIEKFSV